ncbi:MAG: IS66 family transposase, partial [Lachnospiraceae bacterium]|nr:IS66 family transposase [Lachnospiraceae bacterium]
MRPAFCYIEHHNIHVYKSGKKIIRACLTEKLLPHSDISSSTMAYILNGRFVMHLPANRICQEMARNGYPINRQRIYSLTEYFAFKRFELVIERMKQVMFSTGHIQADETEIVMNEKRKDGHVVASRMWVYLTSERNESDLPKVVIYQFELTRCTDHLRSFISGFSGTITSDAYASYIIIDKDEGVDVTVSGCMTHARRKYVDALKALSGFRYLTKEEKEKVPAYVAAKKIGRIFSADKKLNDLEPADRLARRQTEVAPLVDEFFEYVHSFKDTDFSKGGLSYKAFNYSKNQEKYLRLFLSDGHIPLENSASERKVISVALGRNGWKTIATIDGATAAGYMYSLAETAKENGARPYYYYKYLLEKAGALQKEHENDAITDLEYLDPMMPWSDEYRQYEKSELARDNSIQRQLALDEQTKNT